MTFFPDKRSRYVNAAPWDFAAGTPNAANKTKTEAKTSPMARVPDTYEQNEKGEHVLVPGNKSARDTFRVTTARHSEIPDNGSHLTESNAANADTAASESDTLR